MESKIICARNSVNFDMWMQFSYHFQCFNYFTIGIKQQVCMFVLFGWLHIVACKWMLHILLRTLTTLLWYELVFHFWWQCYFDLHATRQLRSDKLIIIVVESVTHFNATLPAHYHHIIKTEMHNRCAAISFRYNATIVILIQIHSATIWIRNPVFDHYHWLNQSRTNPNRTLMS